MRLLSVLLAAATGCGRIGFDATGLPDDAGPPAEAMPDLGLGCGETLTTTGFAALYRAVAGVRVFDSGGRRTLAPSSALADLVTWADHAIVVWTAAPGVVRLTRLCPVPVAP